MVEGGGPSPWSFSPYPEQPPQWGGDDAGLCDCRDLGLGETCAQHEDSSEESSGERKQLPEQAWEVGIQRSGDHPSVICSKSGCSCSDYVITRGLLG